MKGVETFGKYIVESQESLPVIASEEIFNQGEGIVVIKDSKVPDHVLIFHVSAAEGHSLVENGKSVSHSAVRFLGDDMERLVVYLDTFFGRYIPEVEDHVRDRDPVEVVGLAAGEDGRENLVLLCSSEDEYGMCRGFLKSLEEGVESGCREHVDLVYDVDAIFPDLRGNLHLVHQVLDILDSIVRGCVQLMDAV